MILRQDSNADAEITLDVMTADAAPRLGTAFAAIDPWLSHQFPAAALTGYFAYPEPGAPRFVILSGATIAGAVGLRMNWLRGPYLQFLGVLPEYQDKGLGALVLAWFEGTARARDDKNLWVPASGFNMNALRFYERHGFTPAAVLDDLVRPGVSEILLRKRL